ncbi:MAG: hypothetical protein CMH57_09540 [Myxococcales bacterium]|nr:hypothetical protein [Myxococcales bacterium]
MTELSPLILYGPLDNSQAGPVSVDQPVIMGRAASCDVSLDDLQISRCQSRFFRDMEGGLLVEDLGSKNGTYVNSCSITIARLREGDTVRLGDVRFKVVRRAILAGQEPAPRHSANLVKQVDTIPLPGLDSFAGFDGDSTNTASVDLFQSNSHRLTILFSLSRLLQEFREPDAMLNAVSDHLMILLEGDITAILMLDAHQELQPRAMRYRNVSDPRDFTLPPALVKQVIEDRCAVIVSEPQPRSSDAPSWRGPIIAVPIIIGHQVQGLLCVCQQHTRSYFSEADLDLLYVAASLLGPALRNVELAHQKAQHLAELESAHKQLIATQEKLIHTEKLAVLGQFASGILHEVQNHLSPLALADFIAHEYPEADDIQEMTELVIEARERIMELVNELRYFASGKAPELDLEVCDLSHIVRQVIRFTRHDARLQRVRVHIEDNGRIPVFVDNGRIRQVLINLVCNAADAIQGPNGRIAIKVLCEQEEAIVQIRDNGEGIPKAIQPMIFTPFFTTKGDGGLGLGLDICQRIAKEHQGRLTFTSVLGEGTVFRLSLPLHQEPG